MIIDLKTDEANERLEERVAIIDYGCTFSTTNDTLNSVVSLKVDLNDATLPRVERVMDFPDIILRLKRHCVTFGVIARHTVLSELQLVLSVSKNDLQGCVSVLFGDTVSDLVDTHAWHPGLPEYLTIIDPTSGPPALDLFHRDNVLVFDSKTVRVVNFFSRCSRTF